MTPSGRVGKRQRSHRLAAVCAGVLLSLGCLPSAIGHDLEANLRELMSAHETVGLSVAVVKDNAVVYRTSLGWKDRDKQTPLAVDDVFRIASISKSFAAIAILQLVEQGKLSLEDDVGDLIGFPVRNPAFPERVITLGMLLNHSSSITDGPQYGSLDVINPGMGAAWQASYASRAPGAQYEYSNLGYNMVGTIVERVSGQRFDAYVKTHVLEPLGLHGGYVPETLDAQRFAQIYAYREGKGFELSERAYAPYGERLLGYRMGYSTPMLSPTGGMKISAPDLAQYMLMHMNLGQWKGVRLLTTKHARQMQTPTISMDANDGYGLALRTDSSLIPGQRMIGHTGSAYGLYSSMFFDAQRKYGFVVITNGTRDMSVRSEVNRALYQHFIVEGNGEATQ